MTLPIVVVVLALCLNGLSAMGARVQLIDQAAQLARLIARGNDPFDAQHVIGSNEPVVVERETELVCVRVNRQVGVLPISARSCALDAGQ